ncbi:MAG: hypothetical protein ACRDOZ_04235 [Nocardioides sp.]
MLAALMIAVTPAALGLLRNASFTQETPVRPPERSTIQLPPERQQLDREIDERKAGTEDRDSSRTERRQAHNEGDDRPAHRP